MVEVDNSLMQAIALLNIFKASSCPGLSRNYQRNLDTKAVWVVQIGLLVTVAMVLDHAMDMEAKAV